MPNASRMKSSTTFNTRMLRPSANWWCMKYFDQTWLAWDGIVNGSGARRTRRLRGLIRRFSSKFAIDVGYREPNTDLERVSRSIDSYINYRISFRAKNGGVCLGQAG